MDGDDEARRVIGRVTSISVDENGEVRLTADLDPNYPGGWEGWMRDNGRADDI
jgi:hypothetical protein